MCRIGQVANSAHLNFASPRRPPWHCASVGQRADDDFRCEVGARIRASRGSRTLNEFAAVVGVHPSALSRFEKGERLPDATTLVRLSEALGVSTDWILTGQTRGADGAIPAPPPPPRGLDLTLSGFLQAVAERGLARWASEARKSQAPTVAEALHAIDTLMRSPDLANEKGEPREGWARFLRLARSEGKGLRVELPPRSELFANVARASLRTAELAMAVLLKSAEGIPCSDELEALRASAADDGLGDMLTSALAGPLARLVATDLATMLDFPESALPAFEAYEKRRAASLLLQSAASRAKRGKV